MLKMTEQGNYGGDVVRSEIIKGMDSEMSSWSEEFSPRMKDLIALLMINKTEMGNSGEAVVISTTIKPGVGHRL